MKRYGGERLPEDAHIAVVANDAIGNYVASTPLLQMLRGSNPAATLDYYSGTRTQELWALDDRISWGFPLHGSRPQEGLEAARTRASYDLVINLESTCWSKAFVASVCDEGTRVVGPAVGQEGRGDLPYSDDLVGQLAADPEWVAEDLTAKYPFLQTGFIGEIFCRLARQDGPIPTYAVPRREPAIDVPDVLVSVAASLPNKLWPLSRWSQILAWLAGRGLSLGLLGASPDAQRKYWQGDSDEERLAAMDGVRDLRGRLALPEVVGALGRARAVLTIDNGILHLAAAADAPTVGLFRHGIHRLWAPPAPNLAVLTPGQGREVAEIEVSAVREALERVV